MRIRTMLLSLLLLMPMVTRAQEVLFEIKVDTSDWVRITTSIDGHIYFSRPIGYDLILFGADPDYQLHPREVETINDIADDQYWVEINIAGIGDIEPRDYLRETGIEFPRLVSINGRRAWSGKSNDEAAGLSQAILIEIENGEFASVVVYNPVHGNEVKETLAYGFAASITYRELEHMVADRSELTETFYSIVGTFRFQHPADFTVGEYGLENFYAENHDYPIEDGRLREVSLAQGEYHLRFETNLFHSLFDSEQFLNQELWVELEQAAQVYNLDGRYVAMNHFVVEDSGNLEMLLWIMLENDEYTIASLTGHPNDEAWMRDFLLATAQTVHAIDRYDVTLDTSGLSETYSNEVYAFDYPADWYIDELLSMVVLQDDLYTEEDNSPSLSESALAIPLVYGISVNEDGLLLDFQIITQVQVDMFVEQDIIARHIRRMNDADYTDGGLIILEDARRLAWTESIGFPHDGFYYAHDFNMTIELGNDLYGYVHAFAYGGVSMRFSRQRVLSIASTMRLVE